MSIKTGSPLQRKWDGEYESCWQWLTETDINIRHDPAGLDWLCQHCQHTPRHSVRRFWREVCDHVWSDRSLSPVGQPVSPGREEGRWGWVEVLVISLVLSLSSLSSVSLLLPGIPTNIWVSPVLGRLQSAGSRHRPPALHTLIINEGYAY